MSNPIRLIDRLAIRVSRRGVAAGGGLLAAGALVGVPRPARPAARQNVPLAELLNPLITLEAFAVAFYGAARGRGGALPFDDDATRFVRAAQCEDEAHYHYLEAAGAVPSATTFTVPDDDLADQAAFFAALTPVESLTVGAYMAAARAFAAAGELGFVEIAYQIGVVEAQHQALARAYGGNRLPNDRAYPAWQFRAPAEAVRALADLGYVGGRGREVEFPGPVDRYCRGVTGLVPETTDDQPEPEAPPAASPVATPEGVGG